MTLNQDPGLFRHRGYWRWSAGMQLARLPSAMAPLAFTVLTTAVTGSYRLGGAMMAVFVLAELAVAVPAGRLLDRIGPARGLVLMLLGAAGGMAALAAAAAAGASGPVLLVLVVLPGAVAGGLSGGFRTLLTSTVPDTLLTRAIAVDTMALDGVLIAGPPVVALLAAGHPLLPVTGMAAVFLASAAVVPRRTVRVVVVTGPRPRLPVRAALPWLACQFAIGHLLSTVEVAPLPLAQRLGAGEGAAAVIIAVLCGASIAGSAGYAWRGPAPRAGPEARALVLLAGFVAGGCVVAFAGTWPGLFAGVALVGCCTGPLVTVASTRMQALLPEARRAEGFSVSFAVQSTGFGLGSLSVGVLPLTVAPLLGAVSAVAAATILATTARSDGVRNGRAAPRARGRRARSSAARS